MAMDDAAVAAMNTDTPTQEELDNFDDSTLDNTEDTTAQASSDEAVDSAPAAENTAEDEPQTPADPEPEAAPQDKPVPGFIPRSRYNYAAAKRREEREARLQAESEVERLRAELASSKTQAPDYDRAIGDLDSQISDLDTKIDEARADGDNTLAKQLRAQQRQLERHIVALEMQANAPQQEDPNIATQHAVEQIRIESLVPQLESLFPSLQEGNEAFNEPLSDEVMDTFDHFAKTLPRDEALRRAVFYVTAAHGIQPLSAQTSGPRKTDTSKNIKAAAAQPPRLNEAGLDSDKGGASQRLDVMKMSQDDFERLGERDIDAMLV